MAEHSTLQVLCRNTQTALANVVRPNDPADAVVNVVNVAPSTGTPPMASAATEVVLANAVKLNDCAAPTEAVVDSALSADSPPPSANAAIEVVPTDAAKTATRAAVQAEQLWA